MFDLGTQGEHWAAFAQSELEREAELQVHSDGVNREQAAYYHLWVLEYFLFVWLTARCSGQPFSDTFTQTILAMTRFLEDISPPGGEPPQIGDADDGFVARFSPYWPQRPYRELLSAVHAVFGPDRPDVSDKAFWYRAILGTRTEGLPTLDWQRAYPARYPDGGYVVLGSGAIHLVFDAGPLGYLGIAAHGHADALSFCLALDGDWWLVDPGTYAYHSAPEWRDYFRGTAARLRFSSILPPKFTWNGMLPITAGVQRAPVVPGGWCFILTRPGNFGPARVIRILCWDGILQRSRKKRLRQPFGVRHAVLLQAAA